MEYLGVKILLTLAFFATLLAGACWANDKINEYWKDEGDDEDYEPGNVASEDGAESNDDDDDEKDEDEDSEEQDDDLAKAESAVARVMAALESITAKEIAELKGSTARLPECVTEVFACTACIMAGIMPTIGHKNNKVKDLSWGGVKKQCLSKVKVYKNSLLRVKTVIDDKQFPAVNAAEAKKFIAMDGYDPEVIKTENRTAAVLCSFTIYIIEYYDIMLSMDPKRKALAEANATLDAANTKLAQEALFQANFYRDPVALNTSDFQRYNQLAQWNGEGTPGTFNETFKENFLKTATNVWVMGLKDTVVWPREGEWWGQAPAGRPFDGVALPMNQSSWYLSDSFGLRTADEQGKNHFESFNGEHIRMTDAELYSWISKYFK